VDFAPLLLSLEIAAIATAISAVIGVAVGLALTARRLPARDLFDVVITAPMVLPPTVLGYYLLVTIGRSSLLGRTFEHLFGSSIVFTRTGAVCAATVGAIPIVVKSSRAALDGVDRTLVRAARTLGASATRAFFTVQLPLAGRPIVASLMLAFARSLGDFGVTLMVAGDIPGETQTASLAIYDAIQAHRDADALVMVTILTVAGSGILYVVNKLGGETDV